MLVLKPVVTGEYHVSATGNDTHPGSLHAPFRTIQRAATAALPGDTVTVHAGIYREHVDPPRGGTSEATRIVYQAEPVGKFEIPGSEVMKGWTKVTDCVWKVSVPDEDTPGGTAAHLVNGAPVQSPALLAAF